MVLNRKKKETIKQEFDEFKQDVEMEIHHVFIMVISLLVMCVIFSCVS